MQASRVENSIAGTAALRHEPPLPENGYTRAVFKQ
jgi:hypothetical protein